MKFFTTKHCALVLCSVLASAFLFPSCNNDEQSPSAQYVAELQKKLDSTMMQYDRLKSQNPDLDQQMASRDSTINAQAAEIQRLINQLNSKGGATSTTSSANQGQIDRQKKEIQEKENKIKQLQRQLDEQTRQISQLKKQGASSKPTDNSAEYKAQIKQLQSQIAQQEQQIASLRSQNAQSQNDNRLEACEQQAQEYRDRVADLNREVSDYKAQVSTLSGQISQLNAQIASLQQSSAKGDAASESQIASLQSQVSNLQSQLNEARSQMQQLQSDANKAKADYQKAAADLERCQSDLAAQVAQVKSLQSGETQTGKSMAQMNAELAELAQKEAACRATNEELTKSQADLTARYNREKQDLNTSLTSLREQVALLESQVETLSQENMTLRQKLAATPTTTQNNNDAALVADLQAQVANQQAEIARLNQELQQKEAALTAAQSSNKPSKGTVNQKLEELQALCDSYAAEIERLRAENAQLKSENAELKEQVASSADLIAENERLQQKVNLAAVLVTDDLKATPGKSFKDNIVKPTNKASQAKVVRIDCKILDNNVVDPGSVVIYARIADAANHVLTNGSTESFDLNGVSMQYTLKQEIEFTGSGRSLVMLWKNRDNLELNPGLYWVTLYANGYEIGKTSFRLQ